jgi:hypothetical protein
MRNGSYSNVLNKAVFATSLIYVLTLPSWAFLNFFILSRYTDQPFRQHEYPLSPFSHSIFRYWGRVTVPNSGHNQKCQCLFIKYFFKGLRAVTTAFCSLNSRKNVLMQHVTKRHFNLHRLRYTYVDSGFWSSTMLLSPFNVSEYHH